MSEQAKTENSYGLFLWWHDLRIGSKLGIGFGLVLLCLAGSVTWSVLGISRIIASSQEHINGNYLDTIMARGEAEHLSWVEEITALLTDERINELSAETDPHDCEFGRWLHSEDRRLAESRFPSLPPLLKKIETCHKQLHDSGVEIGKHFEPVNTVLPTLIGAVELDNLHWADRATSLFLNNDAKVDTQPKPLQSTFTKWLETDEVKSLIASDPEFKRLIEEIKRPHYRLNEADIEIQETWKPVHPGLIEVLATQLDNHQQWSSTLGRSCIEENPKLEIPLNADECAFGEFLASSQCRTWCNELPDLKSALESCREPHRRMHASALKIKQALEAGDGAKARSVYILETEPALESFSQLFRERIDAEKSLLMAQRHAMLVFNTKTLPAYIEMAKILKECQVRATDALRGKNQADHIFATKSRPSLAMMRDLLSEVRDEVKANVLSDKEILSSAAATRTAMLTTGAGAVVLGIVLAWIIARGIVLPLRKSVLFAETVAEGDLSQHMDIDQGDEIGDLARAFNHMADNLRSVIRDLADNATTLAGASTQLSFTARELTDGAEKTTQESSSVASAAEEMAANMSNMATSTGRITANAKTVAEAVEEMTASISEIANNAEQASSVAASAAGLASSGNQSISQLGAAADEIGKVIETIQDIAEQTNLLALNATIEAARAGDAGKGFAVVATEVKELAKQTADATEDIRQRIEGIQSSTEHAIQSIGQVSEVIQQVNSVSSTIAQAVEEQKLTTLDIAKNLSLTSDAVAAVSAGVTDSANASQEITRTISGVDLAAKDTAQAASQTQAAGQELSEMAGELKSLVGRFKL